jgi:hypothetical protein
MEPEKEDEIFDKEINRRSQAVKSTFEGKSNEEHLKIATEYRDNLINILFSTTALENMIDSMIAIRTKEIRSHRLLKLIRSPHVHVRQKLNLLRFADMIGEQELNDLNIIFKIRDVFAHQLIGVVNLQEVFEPFKDLQLKDMAIRKSTNDYTKFVNVVAFYVKYLNEQSKKHITAKK